MGVQYSVERLPQDFDTRPDIGLSLSTAARKGP